MLVDFLLALRADIDVTGLVLCNRTLHCDVRKAALKGLILTVQAMVGFYFETPGDAMPPIEFVRLWKESLVGYRQTVQWYENVFVNCFCLLEFFFIIWRDQRGTLALSVTG